MRIEQGGRELFDLLPPLWEALFDHHNSVGAAGLETIPRAESWPLRRAHYDRIFAERSWAGIWLVRDETERPVGYALAFEIDFESRPAVVLETLSLLPEVRGHGLGGKLMHLVESEAATRGADRCILDVIGGNARARTLYLRSGYLPYSETWLRSSRPQHQSVPATGVNDEFVVKLAQANGFELEVEAGPDDTWVSSDRLALLASKGVHRQRTTVGLEELFTALESAGTWTILVEIQTAPRDGALRQNLCKSGFKLSLERVVKPLN